MYQANGHTVMDQAYTLDDTGNVTAIADDLDPTRSKSFGYDALHRLTSATGIYGTLAYTYDKAGNRLTETKPGSQDTYDYFPYTSRLRSVTGTHAELIAYDEGGNITSRTPGAGNPTPAVSSPSDYVYNAGGQRVMKTKNGAATVYHYDLDGRLIAETDDEGTLKQAYVWLNGEPLAMIGADGSVYYYHNDHLGTPQALTDQSVNLVWSADYLPFGQASVTTATVTNNLRFPGQVYDPETGLHYNWNRYYDPKLGRYITPDPIGLAGGVNLYAYVQNNPVNFIDPWGLTQQDIDIAVKIIQETQTDLRFPNTVDPSMKSDKYAGEYQMLTDTIKLNENYLKDLTNTQAADLIDTLIHETLHANDSAWKQFLDTFRDHPDIYNETDRRTKELLNRYLEERRQDPCK